MTKSLGAERNGRTSKDALLLIAHGSTRYPDAGRTALAHAATIREQGHFAMVAVGFLNGAPSASEALARLGDRTIHVVPFFMEDGYFTRIAVPKALTGGEKLSFYPPVGSHSGMVDLIRDRIAGHAPSDIVLVGHGSAKSPGRRYALHDHAEQLGARVAFLEEPPFLPDTLAEAAGPSIAVIGLFAGEGGHVRDDLPALIAAGRQRYGKKLIDLGSIGDAPGISDLILDSVARS
ncbi:MAG: CbiX/SirB N-terminal domain-containing protein [Rhodospirillales bacterium]